MAELAHSHEDRGDLLALLKARTGHDFAAYKDSTIGRRLRRRMALLHFDTIADYLGHLRGNPDELERLAEDMLINVTRFFRDSAVWETVAREAIGPLASETRADSGPLRLWVPGCSTGEEAYTLAMLLEEHCAMQGSPCDWQIFATDLNAEAIAYGRGGLYRDSIAEDLSPERLQRFFRRESDGWRISQELSDRVVFARQNALTDPPFSRLDMISCRNLLIYLDAAHQKRLIETFHFALREDGFLLLGNSETAGAHRRGFRTVAAHAHLYRREPGRSAGRLARRAGAHGSHAGRPAGVAPPRERREELAETIRRALLDRYAPAAVAVRGGGEVAYFHGPVGRFLDQPEGAPSASIYDMLPGALRGRVREAVRQLAAGGQPSHRSTRVRFPDRETSVCVEGERVKDGDDPLYLLTFIEHGIEQEDGGTNAGADIPPGRPPGSMIRLENELANAREDLRTTIEELEASNEELTASHEEALAAQEDLETSRAELESLNEELITVNKQLKEKVAQVEKSTDDMRNLLTSTRLPVLFLDPAMRISGFTPTMSGLVELRDSDLGRPATDLAFKVDDPRLLDDVRRTLAELSPSETQVHAGDGTAYLRRIHPYRTSDGRISGVVVTYADITQQARTAELLRSRERQQSIIAELGLVALGARDLASFLNELCASLRVAMECDYAKVLALGETGERLDMVAGAGWKNGTVGAASLGTGSRSQGGYALKVARAVLVRDVAQEDRFEPPLLFTEHGVSSGISCLIQVGGKPWGVLGVHDRCTDHFREEDLMIVQAAANIAATTIMQIERETSLARESLMLALAIKTADLGVWQYDPASGDGAWDERLRQMIGIDAQPGEPTLQDLLDMVVKGDRPRVKAAIQRTIDEGIAYNEEFRLCRPDGSLIWLTGRGERLVEEGGTTILGIIGDITERKTDEEQTRFVMRELDHRVKNVLAIILSIAKITGKAAPDVSSFIAGFEERLHAMARTHSLLAGARWQGARLRTLIEDELAHSKVGDNVLIDGPEVAVSAAAAQALSMALHELCTNALKYGALSVPGGRLSVRWRHQRAGDTDQLLFVWQEREGPPVVEPSKRGFGSTVIERILGAQLDARAEIRFDPEGLLMRCVLPIERLAGSTRPEASATAPPPPEVDLTPLSDLRVLVVDDEWLVAEQHAHSLLGAGAVTVGPFHSVADARDAVATEPIDFALVDYNIGGEPADPLLALLRQRGIPVLIVTGYGAELPSALDDDGLVVSLAKPVSPATMLGQIAAMLQAPPRRDPAASPEGTHARKAI